MGHARRVGLVEWHPTDANILFSSGYDYKVGLPIRFLGLPYQMGNPGGLRQQNFILAQLWKSKTEVLGGPCFLQRLPRGALLCLFWLLVAPGLPWLGAASPQPASVFPWPALCVSARPLLLL